LQIGIVLNNLDVAMVVPGGPAYKPYNGKRIEKNDTVLAIDPDAKVLHYRAFHRAKLTSICINIMV
jgi:hypothetical protein